MNYMWEAALAADRNQIPRERIEFVATGQGSPYTEVVLENLNTEVLEGTVVEVNPLYRFSREFSAVFDINLEDYGQTRRFLFNSTMQYMVQLDLRQGMSRQEYYLRFLLRDLNDGVCGEQALRAMGYFQEEEMRRLLNLLLKLYQCGSSISLFREVMRSLYPESLVYISNEAVREVLIYIGVLEAEEEQEKIGFLIDIFLPINYEVFLFWEYHFGIMDIEETMVLDEMVLF